MKKNILSTIIFLVATISLYSQESKRLSLLTTILSDSSTYTNIAKHIDLNKALLTYENNNSLFEFNSVEFQENKDAIKDNLIEVVSFKKLASSEYKIKFSVKDLIVNAKLISEEGESDQILKKVVKSSGWVLKKGSYRYMEVDF